MSEWILCLSIYREGLGPVSTRYPRCCWLLKEGLLPFEERMGSWWKGGGWEKGKEGDWSWCVKMKKNKIKNFKNMHANKIKKSYCRATVVDEWYTTNRFSLWSLMFTMTINSGLSQWSSPTSWWIYLVKK